MRRHPHRTQVPECTPHPTVYFRVVVMADFLLCAFCPETCQPSSASQSTELGFSPPATCPPPSLVPVLSYEHLPGPCDSGSAPVPRAQCAGRQQAVEEPQTLAGRPCAPLNPTTVVTNVGPGARLDCRPCLPAQPQGAPLKQGTSAPNTCSPTPSPPAK